MSTTLVAATPPRSFRSMRTAVGAFVLLVAPALATAQDAELFERRCREGDLASCNVAGLMHQAGAGVDADLALAMDYYRLACAGGDATGCTSIGLLYQNGRGVDTDEELAAGQYRLACERGDAFGCDLLTALEQEGPITAPRPFTQSGRVLDAETGEAMTDVLVDVPRLSLQALADERGGVDLGRIPEGTYEIRAEALGYEAVSGILNVPGYAQFVLMLHRAGYLEERQPGRVGGLITSRSRDGIAGVEVRVVDGGDASTTTDGEGRFALAGVEPGLARVRFSTPDREPRELLVVVQPGRTARIDGTDSPDGLVLERP